MSWHTGRLCGFDLETTGISVENDRIVTACVVQCGGGQPTTSATWLSDVDGHDIPAEAAQIHGVTSGIAHTQGAPAREVVEQLVAALAQVQRDGIPIVAMNAAFDLTMLDREARRHGVQPLADIIGPDQLLVIDPRVIDKKVDPYRRGSRKLSALCETYEVRIDQAHTSDADAIAACRVAWRLAERYPNLQHEDLRGLHLRQIGWAVEQAESLAAYFARTPGKEHHAANVRAEWPLVPYEAVSA